MVRIPPGVGHRSVPAFLLIALLTLLAACGGSADGADSDERATVPSAVDPTGAVSTTTTEAPEMTVEEEVEAAYLEANRVFFSLMEDPHQPLDELRATRTGESFENVADEVERLIASGELSSYPTGYPQGEILTVSVEAASAILIACEPNDAVVHGAEGQIVNDEVVTRRLEVHLVKDAGAWKVGTEYELEKFSGVRSCE